MREGFLDGVEKVFSIQRLEGHVLVANVELHLSGTTSVPRARATLRERHSNKSFMAGFGG